MILPLLPRAIGIGQIALLVLACGRQAEPEVDETVLDSVTGQGGANDPTSLQSEVHICTESYQERCAIDVEDWTKPVGRAELIAATCTHFFSDPLPACECTLHRTRLAGDSESERPWPEGTPDVRVYPGNRPQGCSEYARTPSCLYCENEFPGCDVGDPNSCDVVCADMAERYDRESQRAYTAVSRVARCGENQSCEYVTEIDGRCFARDPREKDLPSFDCALSDDEILQHAGEEYAATCSERPVTACGTTADCPRGLACNDAGSCVGCGSGSTCLGADGRVMACPWGACAEGEACVEGRCVLEANAECIGPGDCAPGELCVLSGIDATSGRGTAATRSFCHAPVRLY